MVEIAEPLKAVLDVSKEEDPKLSNALQEIADNNKSPVLALIAPYIGKKITPTKVISAYIGLSEEFGVETVLRAIKDEIPNSEYSKNLILLVNSPGGLVQSSYKIARAIRKNFQDIRVFVPHIAASGGTLLSLIGNEIVMGTMSQLSPLDPQRQFTNISTISAATIPKSFQYVTDYFKDKSEDDTPYTYRVLAEKFDPIIMQESLALCTMMQGYAKEILTCGSYSETEAEIISGRLVMGYNTHEEVINFDKAKELGLKVVEDTKYPNEWKIFRMWLSKYLLTSADKHIIRYVLPNGGTKVAGE